MHTGDLSSHGGDLGSIGVTGDQGVLGGSLRELKRNGEGHRE